MPLKNQVFNLITESLSARAEDVVAFAASNCSFEEWINWEAFAACRKNQEWKVTPKPRYSRLGVKFRELGDLLVAEENSCVLIEFALIHGWTMEKWQTKVAYDTEKLKRITDPTIVPMQIVVVTAVEQNIIEHPDWIRKLGKYSMWNQPTDLSYDSGWLPNGGHLAIRGWVHPVNSMT